MAYLNLFFNLCIAGFVCPTCALQINANGQHQSPEIDPSLQAVMPIEWVHVPKSGSSFLNTLIHLPGACPGYPNNFVVNKETMHSKRVNDIFREDHDIANNCNSSALDLYRIGLDARDADCIESTPQGGFNNGKGRFMMFMRQPEQRLLSVHAYHITNSISELKTNYSGQVTKMLTRTGSVHRTLSPPTRNEVEKAKIRLQTGFVFIGITEKWSLSMCLFNKMFEQPCRSFQFANAHATKGNNMTTYNTTVFDGWHDPYDNELYEIAMTMFESNLKKYSVNESSCEPCLREAGVL